MNTVINEHGQRDYSVGEVNSASQMAVLYPTTLGKLISHINSVYAQGGISRHCDIGELRDICESCYVVHHKINYLIKAAYFYSHAKNDNYII